MILRAGLGYFEMDVSVFMINLAHGNVENRESFSKGAFGSVDSIIYDKKKYVTKFLQVQSSFKIYNKGFRNVMK